MNLDVLAGAGLVLVGGILQGLFPVPMKFVRRWNYENIWLVFALTGLVVFHWLLTAITVPHLGEVYRLNSTRSCLLRPATFQAAVLTDRQAGHVNSRHCGSESPLHYAG